MLSPKLMLAKHRNLGKNVIFSDDSKFNIFGSDRKKTLWRNPNTSFQIRNVKPTVQHGGGHIMILRYMYFNGVGKMEFIEGNMKAKQYISILRDILFNSTLNLGSTDSYYFS